MEKEFKTFELRLIELIGFLNGLNYDKNKTYIDNFITELRIYLENGKEI